MRITRWGEYGIHCSSYIAVRAKSDQPLVTANEIAEAQNIPVDYTRQILQRLKNGGLIKTVRGPQGGYLLAKPASEINLADILRASEGETFEILCETNPLNDQRCTSTGDCNVRPIWYKLHDHIETFLKGYTLEYLAAQPCSAAGKCCTVEDAPVQIKIS